MGYLLYNFIDLLFNALTAAIFIRVIISWFGLPPTNRFVMVLHDITEPILAPLRRVIPLVGFLDFSPFVALILLGFVREFLLGAMRLF